MILCDIFYVFSICFSIRFYMCFYMFYIRFYICYDCFCMFYISSHMLLLRFSNMFLCVFFACFSLCFSRLHTHRKDAGVSYRPVSSMIIWELRLLARSLARGPELDWWSTTMKLKGGRKHHYLAHWTVREVISFLPNCIPAHQHNAKLALHGSIQILIIKMHFFNLPPVCHLFRYPPMKY